ncbi:tyrosine-protein phosphatase [Streptomyces sp. NPDC051018]|uniref:tyrosine-protein phosphatase n=1 Tax=Streptomyces sp. NPDC051018 TaxID=3365639 RepID=UPI003788DCC9
MNTVPDTPGVNHRMPRATGLRPGIAHRSGDVTAFTAEEAGVLAERHGLATVLDLRSAPEVERYGPPRGFLAHGVRWLRVPLTGYPRDTIAARRPDVADRARYLHGILTDSVPGSWTRLFRALAQVADRPFLITCHFGKDRTGVVTAALLSLAGASAREIAADYAAGTADLLAAADRFRDKWLRRGHTREDYLSRLRTSPVTMERWLAEVDARYGGIGPALAGVGVAGGDMARVRDLLSVPAHPGAPDSEAPPDSDAPPGPVPAGPAVSRGPVPTDSAVPPGPVQADSDQADSVQAGPVLPSRSSVRSAAADRGAATPGGSGDPAAPGGTEKALR